MCSTTSCFSRLVGCICNELFNCCLFFYVVVIDIVFISTTFYALFCTFFLICTQINSNEISEKAAYFLVQGVREKECHFIRSFFVMQHCCICAHLRQESAISEDISTAKKKKGDRQITASGFQSTH